LILYKYIVAILSILLITISLLPNYKVSVFVQ